MEYKALAQNTYKFVTETVFSGADISNERRPIIPQVKVICGGELKYIVPIAGTATETTSTGFEISDQRGYTTSGGVSYSAFQLPTSVNHSGECIVDRVKYYGIRNCNFFLPFYGQTDGSHTIPERVFPPCTIKVVKYDSSTGSIVVYTIEAEYIAESYTSPGPNNITESVGYAFSHILLSIPKKSDDIILAIEFEYPKYDISITNNTADWLYYSVDNGVIFDSVFSNESETLEKVEHITFKNNSSSSRWIYQNGKQLKNLFPGETFTAVPTASNTYFEYRG